MSSSLDRSLSFQTVWVNTVRPLWLPSFRRKCKPLPTAHTPTPLPSSTQRTLKHCTPSPSPPHNPTLCHLHGVRSLAVTPRVLPCASLPLSVTSSLFFLGLIYPSHRHFISCWMEPKVSLDRLPRLLTWEGSEREFSRAASSRKRNSKPPLPGSGSVPFSSRPPHL